MTLGRCCQCGTRIYHNDKVSQRVSNNLKVSLRSPIPLNHSNNTPSRLSLSSKLFRTIFLQELFLSQDLIGIPLFLGILSIVIFQRR